MVNIRAYIKTLQRFSALRSTPHIMETRDYEDAVKALNTLQTNAQALAQIRQEQGRLVHNKLREMVDFTERAGVSMEELDQLSVIHVSGTKGKGSTCAFCEGILRSSGYKTGFFSSPHLVEVRERIRINGRPISKEMFAKYFFDCFDNLQNSKDKHKGSMPAYFRFLTLMSFHVFLQEKVDVAVLEVGIGGAYDSTNIIRKPVVCGVTSLGMDHVATLGGSLESIAWQKAGIFKPGVPAFSLSQPENAMEVVARRAQELKAKLQVVPLLEDYPGSLPTLLEQEIGSENLDVRKTAPLPWYQLFTGLSLEGKHQFLNASLAIQLCKTWVDNKNRDKTKSYANGDKDTLRDDCNNECREEAPAIKKSKLEVPTAVTFEVSESFKRGLSTTKWPGRSQVIVRPHMTFYLDGAHTPNSMLACTKWFMDRAEKELQGIDGPIARVLLFNLTGDRDPHNLLRPLKGCKFDHAMFSPNTPTLDAVQNNTDLSNFTVTRHSQLSWSVENQRVWMALRGAGFQAHASPSEELEQEHVIQNGLDDGHYSSIFPCVAQALQWIANGQDPDIKSLPNKDLPVPDVVAKATRVQVLVTGSLHLVGSAMKVLGPEIVGEI